MQTNDINDSCCGSDFNIISLNEYVRLGHRYLISSDGFLWDMITHTVYIWRRIWLNRHWYQTVISYWENRMMKQIKDPQWSKQSIKSDIVIFHVHSLMEVEPIQRSALLLVYVNYRRSLGKGNNSFINFCLKSAVNIIIALQLSNMRSWKNVKAQDCKVIFTVSCIWYSFCGLHKLWLRH